jgi:hypothetical protein
MSTLAVEIEKELNSLDPDAAFHFERAVREILSLIKARQKPPATRVPYQLPVFSMGINPEIDMTKLGQLSEDL